MRSVEKSREVDRWTGRQTDRLTDTTQMNRANITAYIFKVSLHLVLPDEVSETRQLISPDKSIVPEVQIFICY